MAHTKIDRMDTHDRGQFDQFQNFRLRGPDPQGTLNMAAHAGPVKVGGGGVDGDKDHLFV